MKGINRRQGAKFSCKPAVRDSLARPLETIRGYCKSNVRRICRIHARARREYSALRMFGGGNLGGFWGGECVPKMRGKLAPSRPGCTFTHFSGAARIPQERGNVGALRVRAREADFAARCSPYATWVQPLCNQGVSPCRDGRAPSRGCRRAFSRAPGLPATARSTPSFPFVSAAHRISGSAYKINTAGGDAPPSPPARPPAHPQSGSWLCAQADIPGPVPDRLGLRGAILKLAGACRDSLFPGLARGSGSRSCANSSVLWFQRASWPGRLRAPGGGLEAEPEPGSQLLRGAAAAAAGPLLHSAAPAPPGPARSPVRYRSAEGAAARSATVPSERPGGGCERTRDQRTRKVADELSGSWMGPQVLLAQNLLGSSSGQPGVLGRTTS